MIETSFQKLRRSREILGTIDTDSSKDLTVFVGLFNSERYFDKVISELKEQNCKDFNILMVDNSSDDSTWEQMKRIIDFFPKRLLIVRNPINLGANGTIALNIDLIKTEWFCQLHQDDEYGNKYISSFIKSIKKADSATVSISAEMGSIRNDGKRNSTPLRANWFLPTKDPITAFLANIRTHTVPAPATAFRSRIYESCISPWHSNSFPDTETALLMCAYGDFQFIKKKTMNYRENEMSESHTIDNHESLFGAGVSLARVFSSNEFKSLLMKIDMAQRSQFLKSLEDSINARLGTTEFAKFISYIAAENCMIAWEYSNNSSIEIVQKYQKQVGANATTALLDRILEFNDGLKPSMQETDSIGRSTSKDFLVQFLGASNSNINRKNLEKSFLRTIYDSITSLLPFTLQKIIGKTLLRLKIFINPNHGWNFKWR